MMRTAKTDCPHEQTIGWGKDRYGNPRRKCKACGATRGIIPARPLGRMRLSLDKATEVLKQLTEGCSIRATERITGVHRDTVCKVLRATGAKCEALLSRLVRDVEVKDVQADEVWCFVGMKEKTKTRLQNFDPALGDAYTFVGIERSSKVILAWHLGRRTYEDTSAFIGKLARATRGAQNGSEKEETWHLSTDAWKAYPGAIDWHLGGRVDYGQVIKTYGGSGTDGERRYSPPQIIRTEKIAVSGRPDAWRVCTSHIERQNLHVRMQMRRFTRLTNGFSRKRENLRAALALHFAAYNFTWMHSTIRMTPAMKAGIARKPWTVRDLLLA
ncbi:MAG TPA: IS1 family transposase [Thermoanaerobaculia bacterium]|nr:IS1 family transposase [Thermoanaerobaculia bacterium]